MQSLNNHDIYVIPVGKYFEKADDSCYLVYAPLANFFFLSTKEEVGNLEEQMKSGNKSPLLKKLLMLPSSVESSTIVSTDTFCTLHILLNEKCNFNCRYCYSAKGRSNKELGDTAIKKTLDFFLSSERKAVKKRTVMFMGGGEPMLSWKKVMFATMYAEKIAAEQGIDVRFQLTTNGSVLSDEMISFFKEHDFTLQVSFEMLPEVQNAQRGHFTMVANNLHKLTEAGIRLYVRSTVTELNVDHLEDAVQYCHEHFPLVTKYSCQQVVDPAYFDTPEKVDEFFSRYRQSFLKADKLAEQYGIDLRSSSSHLQAFTKRERFCYNLMVLTPYETITLCPDISSPQEEGYEECVVGIVDSTGVTFNQEQYYIESDHTIHKYEKCRNCYARWNCGSGCPSSRKVYSEPIFDAICEHYKHMLIDSLMKELAKKYKDKTGGELYHDIKIKLSE